MGERNMTIKVKLKNKKVTITPPHYSVKHGSHPIAWESDDDSEKFDFAEPPLTFDDPKAPMSNPSHLGGNATCTDNNQNGTDSDMVYRYHVYLIGPHGPVTHPRMKSRIRDGDPYIHNKPK
jgi:hypothetical protein